jgi:hypothetical protein
MEMDKYKYEAVGLDEENRPILRNKWNGKLINSSSRRCRPPRCALYPPRDEREFRRDKRNHFNRIDDKRWEAVGE